MRLMLGTVTAGDLPSTLPRQEDELVPGPAPSRPQPTEPAGLADPWDLPVSGDVRERSFFVISPQSSGSIESLAVE